MDKKRLDLKFRPDDVFSKPIYGDLKSVSGLLVKITHRRRKHNITTMDRPDCEDEEKVETKSVVLGIVRQMFKFEGKTIRKHESRIFFKSKLSFRYL